MAGLITDLLQSAQNLDAQQMAIQVTGNNLANVNNASYARQTVQIGSAGVMETSVGEVSMGVVATGITQARNPFLDAQVAQEISQTNILQAQNTQLQQAQANLGEQVSSTDSSSSITDTSQSTTGISSAINNFFDAANSLSATPTDVSASRSCSRPPGPWPAPLIQRIPTFDAAKPILPPNHPGHRHRQWPVEEHRAAEWPDHELQRSESEFDGE